MISRRFIALAVTLSFAAVASAVSVPANFLIDSNNSNFLIDVTAKSGLLSVSDSDSTSVSGTIETLLDIGTGDPLPSIGGISVTGGRLYADDTISLAFNIFLLLDVDVLVEDISATISTPLPPGTMSLVNPATGQFQFDLAEHLFTADQGTISATGRIGIDNLDEMIDLNMEPVSGSPDPGQYLGTLTINETGSDATSRFFHADMLFPVNVLEDVPLNDAGTLIATVSITGNLTAAADFAVPLGLPGDYNDNGTIDAADYSAWRDAVIAGSSSLLNDPTPGTVDESDFAYWRDHFGQSLGAGAGLAAMAVPEPAGGILFLGAAIAFAWRRRRIAA